MKKILLLGAVLLALGIGVAYYMWNKPKKSAESENVFAHRDATDLYTEFTTDPTGSFQVYNQKNVEVRGIVDAFAKDSTGTKITLKTMATDGGIVTISLVPNDNLSLPVVGDSVHVRGLCAGYISDDTGLMGGEVQLNQGIIIKK
jgi:phage tail sheath gpL-like